MKSGGMRGRRRHVPPLKKRLVGMTDAQAALLRKWGRGDLSAGLRWLVDAAAVLVRRKDEIEEEYSLDKDATPKSP